MIGKLRMAILRVPEREVSFERRGFRGGSAAFRARLERIGGSLLDGYHAALAHGAGEAALAARLDLVDAEHRGFAFEGAAMGLAILDALSPLRRRRLRRFIAGPAATHVYMALVGVGWAAARLPRWLPPPKDGLDSRLQWLIADGYGFHHGFFQPAAAIDGQRLPAAVSGYARRAFDQGLGRSLWFVEGAESERIARTIGSFPEHRRADLWSGIGLACCYAGGADRAALAALRRAAADYHAELSQGVVFAAKTRVLAGNLSSETELACQELTGLSASAAAAIADRAEAGLAPLPRIPDYEVWRQRIQAAFAVAEVST